MLVFNWDRKGLHLSNVKLASRDGKPRSGRWWKLSELVENYFIDVRQ